MPQQDFAMLRVSRETHDRFMLFMSRRHVETGEKKMTVTDAVNELLDIDDNIHTRVIRYIEARKAQTGEKLTFLKAISELCEMVEYETPAPVVRRSRKKSSKATSGL